MLIFTVKYHVNFILLAKLASFFQSSLVAALLEVYKVVRREAS